MPTGYTAFIEEGKITTGKEFLKLCLREFGLAIELRDKPLDIPVPTTFEPNSFYKTQYENAVERLNAAKNLSLETVKFCMKDDHDKRVKEAERILNGMLEVNERYAKVRNEIIDWIPPTPDHETLKEFALKQIDMCVNSNRLIQYYQDIINTPFDSSDEAAMKYMEDYLELLEKDVERAQRSYYEEVLRAKEKTKFMKDFIDSL